MVLGNKYGAHLEFLISNCSSHLKPSEFNPMDEQPAAGDGGLSENHRQAPEPVRDWSDLTPVLLVNVFRRLSVQDRWTGPMLACRSWLEAARDPSLFSSFDLEPYFVAADSARWWTAGFERRIDSMVRSVADWGAGSVKELRVRHCSDWSLSLVAERYDSNHFY